MEGYLIDVLIRITIWLGVVSLFVLCLRRASATTRHIVWSVGVVGSLLLPVVATTPGVAWLPALAIAPVQNERVDSIAVESVVPPLPPATTAQLVQGAASNTTVITGAPDPTPVEQVPVGAATNPWLFAWFAGSTLMALHLLVAVVAVMRALRRSIPAPESIHRSVIATAGELGVDCPYRLRRVANSGAWTFCSTLVMPEEAAEWTPARRRSVLVHELAHLHRRDWLTNLCGRVLRVALWFHPLVWLATRRLHVEQERACDDAVLRIGTLPSSYAEDLTALASQTGADSTVECLTSPIVRKSAMVERIRYLLEDRDRARASRLAVNAILIGGLAVATLTGAVQRAESDVPRVAATEPTVEPDLQLSPQDPGPQDPNLPNVTPSQWLEVIMRLPDKARGPELKRFGTLGVQAIPPLEHYAQHPDQRIAYAALDTLARIVGADDQLVAASLRLFADLDSDQYATRFLGIFQNRIHRSDVAAAVRSSSSRAFHHQFIGWVAANPSVDPEGKLLLHYLDDPTATYVRAVTNWIVREENADLELSAVLRRGLSHDNVRTRRAVLANLSIGSPWTEHLRSELAEIANKSSEPKELGDRANALLAVGSVNDKPNPPTIVADYAENKIIWFDEEGNRTREMEEMYGIWDVEQLADGHLLVVQFALGRVYEVNAAGENVWEFSQLKNPYDADRLPNGNTLIADTYANRVIEVNPEKEIVWMFSDAKPLDVERLANGNTLIADGKKGNDRILEVDPSGKIVWQLNDMRSVWDVDRLPNGNTLITQRRGRHRVFEVDKAGEVVFELIDLNSPSDADRLPNGNTIVACDGSVVTFDPRGNPISSYEVAWAVEVNVIREE